MCLVRVTAACFYFWVDVSSRLQEASTNTVKSAIRESEGRSELLTITNLTLWEFKRLELTKQAIRNATWVCSGCCLSALTVSQHWGADNGSLWKGQRWFPNSKGKNVIYQIQEIGNMYLYELRATLIKPAFQIVWECNGLQFTLAPEFHFYNISHKSQTHIHTTDPSFLIKERAPKLCTHVVLSAQGENVKVVCRVTHFWIVLHKIYGLYPQLELFQV